MPTLFCCILNCETESVSSKKRKIFYRLPQNADRKQLWLNQFGDRIKYGTISSNSRICNSHFATGKPNLDSSHIDYIPTIFPWSTKEEKSKCYQAVDSYETKIKELEQKILAKAFLNASNDAKMPSESELTKIEAGIEIEQKNNLQKINTKSDSSVAQIQPSISHPSVTMSNRSSSIDLGNTVTLNNNLLNYLINSLTHVNIPNSTNTVNALPLSVNIAMPTCPLNLSQSYNKIDTEQQMVNNEIIKSTNADTQLDNRTKSDFFKPGSQNGQMFSFQIQNVIAVSQSPIVQTSTSSDDTNSRSCTCTKSSCLKLYCECFATGNICSSGCTCINCRNNNQHKEERAKIVSSYLERDPCVFSSKIDSQDVGKKHSKGCNCLKSSCLKNYCECFENKVFCSSLCRCRMCCNNEDHAMRNPRRDDANHSRIYPASHTSDSLSVLSENSPLDSGRKRKTSVLKSNDIYEDVSSNKYVQESSEELNIKRQQLDSDIATLDNDRLSGRSITSMDIPPVLPQEDDFTEEELAIMLKFREQRSVKIESVSPPLVSPRSLSAPINFTTTSHANQAMSSLINIPTSIDPNLLFSISKSLGAANIGLVNNNAVHQPQDTCKLIGNDLLNLLVTQQLMLPRQPPPQQQASISPSYNHVIPINLTQQNCVPQSNGVPCGPSMITSSRPIATATTSIATVPGNSTPSKTKLSTEDYVRRHIEAAERAVRADNMRRDCIGSKKAIMKQKIKIEPNNNNNSTSPQKCSPSILVTGANKHVTTVDITGDGQPTVIGKHGHHNVEEYPLVTTHPVNRTILPHKHDESTVNSVTPVESTDRDKWKNRYRTLRMSLHNMRTELRSIKVHMRADQSKIRRLESALLHMSNELNK